MSETDTDMGENIERIGEVILDLSEYRGDDRYSEGAEEDRLLEIVKEHKEFTAVDEKQFFPCNSMESAFYFAILRKKGN